MPLMNQIRGGMCSPTKYAPDEIQNRMFKPQMKKASLSLDKKFCPISSQLCPRSKFFLGSAEFFLSRPLVQFYAHLKMEYAPDQKDPGHASVLQHIFSAFFCALFKENFRIFCR